MTGRTTELSKAHDRNKKVTAGQQGSQISEAPVFVFQAINTTNKHKKALNKKLVTTTNSFNNNRT